MTKRLIGVALATALLTACAGGPASRKPQASATPAAPVPVGPPANDGLNAVLWSQTAVEHDLVYREVFQAAGEKLQLGLKDRQWDALPKGERKGPLKKLKPAVIVDIDETVLDNSPYQARLIRDGSEYNEATWAAWCREKAAKPLPGALEFAKLAAKKGVTVFYLSNRAQDLNDVTLENLREAGFPLAAGEKVFLGLGTMVAGCEQVGTEKGCRRKSIGAEHRVLLQLGDQVGDFVDVPVATPEGRAAAIAPYNGWIGERWFVLPNPMYGAWEPALFNNDGSQPAGQRRDSKMRALQESQ